MDKPIEELACYNCSGLKLQPMLNKRDNGVTLHIVCQECRRAQTFIAFTEEQSKKVMEYYETCVNRMNRK